MQDANIKRNRLDKVLALVFTTLLLSILWPIGLSFRCDYQATTPWDWCCWEWARSWEPTWDFRC